MGIVEPGVNHAAAAPLTTHCTCIDGPLWATLLQHPALRRYDLARSNALFHHFYPHEILYFDAEADCWRRQPPLGFRAMILAALAAAENETPP